MKNWKEEFDYLFNVNENSYIAQQLNKYNKNIKIFIDKVRKNDGDELIKMLNSYKSIIYKTDNTSKIDKIINNELKTKNNTIDFFIDKITNYYNN